MTRRGKRGERGVTLFEVALVVTIAAILVLSVIAGRAVVEMSRENAVVRVVGTVQANFNAFLEARRRLPGDTGGDGQISGADDAVQEMVDQRYLDADATDTVPTPGVVILPYNQRGSILTVPAGGPASLVGKHALRVTVPDGASVSGRYDSILDDGVATSGDVQVEDIAGTTSYLWIVIQG